MKGSLRFSLVVTLVALISPAVFSATTRSCSGFAPTTTSCSTGTFTRSSSTIAHDVSADINYAGTIESALVWGSKSRIFRCTFAPGIERRCLGLGEFPPLFATFTHRCRSLMPGSAFTVISGVGLSGIEGGIGTWSCTVTV